MVAYAYRMPAGIAGEANRGESLTIEPAVITPAGSSGHPTFYGCALALDATSKQMRLPTTGDAAAAIYGFLVRPFPTGPGSGLNDPLGTSTPPDSGPCNVLKRGYIEVKLFGATAAAKGGGVFVRIDTAGAGQAVGGVEAAADSTHTVQVPNCYFMGPADASGNVEIAYNL